MGFQIQVGIGQEMLKYTKIQISKSISCLKTCWRIGVDSLIAVLYKVA